MLGIFRLLTESYPEFLIYNTNLVASMDLEIAALCMPLLACVAVMSADTIFVLDFVYFRITWEDAS